LRFSRDQSEFDRAIAFIDATFAVALTLIVTTLDVGNPSKAFKSPSALYDAVGPQFLAFLIAFAVIASYWLAHHRMVASFKTINSRTLVINLLLLAAIVLMPFTTSSVGDPDVADLPLPTVVMALDIVAVSCLFTLVWVTAARDGLLDHAPGPTEWRQTMAIGLAPALVFLLSIPIAYLAAPSTARLFWLTLIVVNPAAPRLAARIRRSRNTAN
jgi:uncharacterized membrane protein